MAADSFNASDARFQVDAVAVGVLELAEPGPRITALEGGLTLVAAGVGLVLWRRWLQPAGGSLAFALGLALVHVNEPSIWVTWIFGAFGIVVVSLGVMGAALVLGRVLSGDGARRAANGVAWMAGAMAVAVVAGVLLVDPWWIGPPGL